MQSTSYSRPERISCDGRVPENAEGIMGLRVPAHDQHGQPGFFGMEFLENIVAALLRQRNIQKHHVTGFATNDLESASTLAVESRSTISRVICVAERWIAADRSSQVPMGAQC
jgi:hypothetical protein